jgi:hypothetical protein
MIIDRIRQIQLRPQVPLRRLKGSVAEQQLNLLEVAAGGPAELGASPS